MPADDILAGVVCRCGDGCTDLWEPPPRSCSLKLSPELRNQSGHCIVIYHHGNQTITNSVISMSAAQTFGTLHSLIFLYCAFLYTTHLLLKKSQIFTPLKYLQIYNDTSSYSRSYQLYSFSHLITF